MSVLRPRSRLVYFRVSEDEFQQLNEICMSSGARSISDLARRAIEQALVDRVPDARRESHSDVLQRLDRLTQMVENLEARFDAKAVAGGEGNA